VLLEFAPANHGDTSILRLDYQDAIDKVHLPGPDREVGIFVFLLVNHRHIAIFPAGKDRCIILVDGKRLQLKRDILDFRMISKYGADIGNQPVRLYTFCQMFDPISMNQSGKRIAYIPARSGK
jgi:hypothetical protein